MLSQVRIFCQNLLNCFCSFFIKHLLSWDQCYFFRRSFRRLFRFFGQASKKCTIFLPLSKQRLNKLLVKIMLLTNSIKCHCFRVHVFSRLLHNLKFVCYHLESLGGDAILMWLMSFTARTRITKRASWKRAIFWRNWFAFRLIHLFLMKSFSEHFIFLILRLDKSLLFTPIISNFIKLLITVNRVLICIIFLLKVF